MLTHKNNIMELCNHLKEKCSLNGRQKKKPAVKEKNLGEKRQEMWIETMTHTSTRCYTFPSFLPMTHGPKSRSHFFHAGNSYLGLLPKLICQK